MYIYIFIHYIIIIYRKELNRKKTVLNLLFNNNQCLNLLKQQLKQKMN